MAGQDLQMHQPAPDCGADEASSHFDASAFGKLLEIGQGSADTDFVDNLIDRFLRATPVRLAVLQAAAGSGDCETLEFEAHSMKSSCGYIGALVMVELCQALESSARAGNCAEAPRQVEALRASFGVVAAKVRAVQGKGADSATA